MTSLASLNPPRQVAAFPWANSFVLLVTGSAASLAALGPGGWHAALAVMALAAVVALTWHRRLPPILTFCLFIQWIYCTVGDWFYWINGSTLSGVQAPSDTAFVPAMMGFVALSIGVSVAFVRSASTADRLPWQDCSAGTLLNRLTLMFMALFLSRAVGLWGGLKILPGTSQVLVGLEMAMFGTLLAIWMVVFAHRIGLRRAAAITLLMIAMGLQSRQSGFAGPLFQIVAACIYFLRPWAPPSSRDAHRSNSAFRVLVALGIVLFSLGALWEGRIKPVWRTADLPESVMDRAEIFVSLAMGAGTALEPRFGEARDFGEDAERLLTRMSSRRQFDRVVQRVPGLLPHTDGEFFVEAVLHPLMPRVLFPEKRVFDSSEVTRQYAGIAIGAGTSIGIGYMAELYIDFGPAWMLVALVTVGWLVARVALLLLDNQRSILFPAFGMQLAMSVFMSFEADLAKMTGSLLSGAIVLWPIAWFSRNWLHADQIASPAEVRHT